MFLDSGAKRICSPFGLDSSRENPGFRADSGPSIIDGQMDAPGTPPSLSDELGAALFETMAAAADGYVSCIDRERRILFLNRGRSRNMEEIVGMPLENFVAQQHRKLAIDCVERALSTGDTQTADYAVVLKDGTQRYLRMRVLPLTASGKKDRALVLTNDVTERHELIKELERSVEFRRRVIENLPDFVTLLDRDHRFVWANRFRRGLKEEDVIGKTIESFRSPGGSTEGSDVIEAAFVSGEVGQYETVGRSEDGQEAFYLARVVPIALEGKIDNVLLITSNITKRKHAERALQETQERLHRAQRLESLGQLAGGVAHDFNNLLQVIYGNLSFAEQQLQEGRMIRDELEQALRATEQAAELTSRLLAIGRRKQVDPKRVDLGGLVEHSVQMLRRAIPENVRVQFQRPEQACYVQVDPPEFEQVLINLCVNARDAMPEGGTLSVEVEAADGAEVLVKVSDTGPGIERALLNRIFEPFFTTKGAGSGLGLAVAAGIVAAHGGSLGADSDGATGSTFTIRLPRVEASAEDSAAPASPAPHGEGVILVAEDDELVRAQLARILQAAGYTVLAAENGARAVELFREHAGRVDLALLDAIMPELDGWQTYLKLEELKPGIRVLFTTGYAADVLPEAFQQRGTRLLSKPFNRRRLLEQVAELTDRNRIRP